VDIWVMSSQAWLNSTYADKPGYQAIEVDGETGWQTMYALTRALQIELGISPTSTSFGPTTLSQLTSQVGNVGSATVASRPRIVGIMQCALWCKGYWGHTTFGQWDPSLNSSIASMRGDMGLDYLQTTVTPKMFKSLLTMDAYSLVGGGDATVRSIQRWMNGRYLTRADFYVVPCDGIYSRDVQRGLMYSIQYEIGMADGTANGNFGPGTKSGLQTQANLSLGSTDTTKRFVRLFQAALTFNGFVTAFDGVFGSGTDTTTRSFQQFVALPQNGHSDLATWSSLLVSTGDTTRPATAADCITTITTARAQTLINNGYTTVGRYLTNTPVANALNKNIKPGELQTILLNGLKVFPIFQEGGTSHSSFSQNQGRQAAFRAHAAARAYGFKTGTTIYFAVDFDAYESEVWTYVVPHFQGINQGFSEVGSPYRVGIYGARNTCRIVSQQGYAELSFVGDMSTGYSGNLGFPLPANWAFDQIIEYSSIGSGNGAIGIDKDVASGRDGGQTAIDLPTTLPQYVTFLEGHAELYKAAHPSVTDGAGDLVLQYLRHDAYSGPGWNESAGPILQDWIDYITGLGAERVYGMVSPVSGNYLNADHLAAATHGLAHQGLNWMSTIASTNAGDYCGWAGDLTQAMCWWINYKRANPSSTLTSYQWAQTYIGGLNSESTFGASDLDEDVDAMSIARAMIGDDIGTAVTEYYAPGGPVTTRFTRFFDERFFSDWGYARDTCTVAFDPTDPWSAVVRIAIIQSNVTSALTGTEWNMTDWNGLREVFIEKLMAKVAAE
jgi:peptidoglycan hydrolase-like protein with peptidoglycan-binding domain